MSPHLQKNICSYIFRDVFTKITPNMGAPTVLWMESQQVIDGVVYKVLIIYCYFGYCNKISFNTMFVITINLNSTCSTFVAVHWIGVLYTLLLFSLKLWNFRWNFTVLRCEISSFKVWNFKLSCEISSFKVWNFKCHLKFHNPIYNGKCVKFQDVKFQLAISAENLQGCNYHSIIM